MERDTVATSLVLLERDTFRASPTRTFSTERDAESSFILLVCRNIFPWLSVHIQNLQGHTANFELFNFFRCRSVWDPRVNELQCPLEIIQCCVAHGTLHGSSTHFVQRPLRSRIPDVLRQVTRAQIGEYARIPLGQHSRLGRVHLQGSCAFVGVQGGVLCAYLYAQG